MEEDDKIREKCRRVEGKGEEGRGREGEVEAVRTGYER